MLASGLTSFIGQKTRLLTCVREGGQDDEHGQQ